MLMSYFIKSIEETEKELKTDINHGLTEEEVKRRQEKQGLNKLEGKKNQSLFIKFLNQFKDFMIIILIIAAVVSGIVGVKEGEGFTDTIIIMIVVIVNAIIGVVQEDKAEKSLEALQKMSSHVSKVIRNRKAWSYRSNRYNCSEI